MMLQRSNREIYFGIKGAIKGVTGIHSQIALEKAKSVKGAMTLFRPLYLVSQWIITALERVYIFSLIACLGVEKSSTRDRMLALA